MHLVMVSEGRPGIRHHFIPTDALICITIVNDRNRVLQTKLLIADVYLCRDQKSHILISLFCGALPDA
jgi:hypothetical protein